ncbi:MAG TPA: hypothetical protein VF529_17925 [Solirubrobacteraceae bacterium]|jgi:hypothetical protein
MAVPVKGLAIITAVAALALTPQAAAAKKPLKAKDRGARVEKGKKRDSAQQRCRDERKELGTAAFAAKYGKPRTKGSAKAKAKAARAAFGRCVSQAAKQIRAEREAADEEADLAEDDISDDDDQDIDEVVTPASDDDFAGDDSDLPHGGKHTFADDDDADDEDDDPVAGLDDDDDLD